MMDLFPLQVFPQGSLASSVITTVWVGVFVIAFLNLRFGWALTGLVVPGYLVPLLLLKPWSVLAIFIEGVVTYGIVWFLFEYLPRFGAWSRLFGRDRFFALILVSIVVRVVFDGWLFQQIGAYLVQHFYIHFDYRDNLHSFGLIIVILIANHFWKPGLGKGALTLGVSVALTYLIVRYGLLELTNFRVSDLGYLYEELASSVLAGPKSYIILITAAYVASRMNLRYGWDFSGILIPALIAMQWFQPIKILASIGEAFVILLLARLVLNSPLFRTASIEGARKILLFFNLGFAYKFLLAYVLLWLAPEVKVTDYFGFGYLLSTLIAIKMYDKGIAMRMARAVLQTSLVAIVMATLIGFSLTLLPNPLGWRLPGAGAMETIEVQPEPDVLLADRLRKDGIRLYRHWSKDSFVEPLPAELDVFTNAMKALKGYIGQRDPKLLNEANTALATIGYRISLLESHYLYIHETRANRGWGIYVLDLERPRGLLVEVPSPVSERGALNAGLVAFLSMQGRALAVAGAPRKVNLNGTADVTTNLNLCFQAFHRIFSSRDVLQVRGYSLETARALYGVRKRETDIDLPALPTKLWVKKALPPSLDLALLKHMLGEFQISWDMTPFRNIQRDYTQAGFGELFLNAKDVRRLMARFLVSRTDIQSEVGEQRIDGYLQDWLLSGKINIAQRGSNAYVLPRQEHLLYIDREIVSPLVHLMREEFRDGRWTEQGEQELRSLASSASVIGYQLIRYTERRSGDQYLILNENPQTSNRRYWGTYVFSPTARHEAIIQVPRPLFEVSTFEYGVSLFKRLGARALLIGGAHHEANLDRSSDLIKIRNIANVFNLVNQVLLREAGAVPMLVIQCRGFGAKPNIARLPDADVLLGYSDGVIDPSEQTDLEQNLYQAMVDDGLKVRIVDGRPDTIGYEVGALPQSLYLNQTRNKTFAVLWLSSLTRYSYRQQNENFAQAVQFRALGLSQVDDELRDYLASHRWSKEGRIPAGLKKAIARYIASQDIVALQELTKEWPDYVFGRLVDINTHQSFLIVREGQRILLVANLVPRETERAFHAKRTKAPDRLVERFVVTRAAWLFLEGGQ